MKLLYEEVGRDAWFRLEHLEQVEEEPASTVARLANDYTMALPDPFWPHALGLDIEDELAFLRSLAGSAPLLCILEPADDAGQHPWLQPT